MEGNLEFEFKEEIFIKRQGHRGQRSNLYISKVLGPILLKFGELKQVHL